MATTTERVDGFDGDEEQYIAYLEVEIKRLRQRSDANKLSPIDEPIPSSRTGSPLGSDGEPQHPPKRAKSSSPAWRRHAEALVKKTPQAPEWWSALRSQGIYDVMRSGMAVAFLLGDESSPPTANGIGTICEGNMMGDELALLRHIAHYAHAATRRRLTASVAIRLANFQHLLVLSTCAVIKSVARPSVPEGHILDIVKISLGDVSEQYCRRMLDTAVYVNRLVDLLNAHGWDGRAAELLLWCLS